MTPKLRAVAVLAAALLPTARVSGQASALQRLAPTEMFAATCARCHGPGGWGTRELAKRSPPGQAQLLERKSVPADMVRYVVRHGIGSMPPFTPTDLTDAELDRLARWLERRSPAGGRPR